MLKALICVTIVILLVVCQSYGLQCKNGQTNYTTTHYADKYKVEYTTATTTVRYETCTFWIINCRTKYTKKTKMISQMITVQKPYEVVNCCPGFFNDSNGCTQGCEEGLYGTNCTQNCTWCPSYCDMYSGNCTCEPGYTGDNCSQECSSNFYGVNCEHNCRCKNNSTCNAADGSCNCTSPGWEGALCDQECTNNTYGLFCNETCMCNENQTCDHVHGSCICKSGWHGENCSEECDAMTFGVDCLKNCTCDRSNTQTCDRETGYCHCKPGYKNRDCDSECTAGTFGPNCIWLCNCNNSLNDSCNNTSGQCVCDSGWTGRTCDQECGPGTYGPSCSLYCNCTNSKDKSCHNVTGQCDCKPGWIGRTCDNETDSSISDIEYLSDNSQGFFEDNMLYLIIGLIALFILTTLTITVVCIRRRHMCSSMFKSGAKGASIISNSQENPGYDASLKDAIQISNMSSIATPNNYEEADIELKGDNVANNDSHIISNGTCSDKSAENRGSALTKRETAQELEEDEYSVPDKHTHTHNGDQSNDDRNSQEVYNCTQDDAKTDNTPNEYNTFSDVKKIQKEAGKQKNESDSEEDYDVISHSGRTDSKKKNLKDHEHENYSSFEQVRKLSLKDSANEEEDTYNALNEHLHVHKSAHINISQYHHISLKDKTVDGEEFDQTKPAVRITSQRQSSTSHRLSKQKSFPEKDVITEDSEEEQEDVNTETKLKVNDIIEDDMTEVIYDECGVDDEDNAPNIEEVKKVADVPVSKNANIDEVVYEECDENVNEQSNAVLYEDVDNVSQKSDSSEEVEDEEDEGKDKHEHGPDHQQQMPLIKRTKERRREDYEEFNL
ncbi:protein draper-like isoform X3 [Ruditapes philippinarum]|uniref:protein draper-like isoform X3 n=1 Tax=Ruditapes philippinarum TaxID=129788 RepID=UPI00295AA74A|nr:protein draper-like isoform X3 [Ruditapes philippinarum]